MNSFTVSRAARADLKNIAAYTQTTWGAKQRKIYIKELDKTFHFLADNPLSGTACDYIDEGLRKHPHQHHFIFYEINHDNVFIVRVLHKSMDADVQLGSP